jgi:hypothetical protein
MALGEAVAARVAAEHAALAEEWTAELTGIAARVAVLHTDEQLRRMAFLVRRARISDADTAVERLRGRVAGRAGIEYVGPLPVYSFLDEIDADMGAAPRGPTSRWGW